MCWLANAPSSVVHIRTIDKCKVTGYTGPVKIRSFLHKGLWRLYEEGDPKGLPPSSVDKLRKMIVYLEAMDEVGELRTLPVWKAHLLTGGRKGTWSLHVTRNLRMTFWIDNAEREICDVNLEDYH
jgi:proteic killer suppression protein